jgi:hypothetical protein
MGIEKHGERAYRYRKVRMGVRVTSVYEGPALPADLPDPAELARREARDRDEHDEEEQAALAALALDLLSRNYNLQGGDFRKLLRFREDAELYGPYWQPIIDVAVGNTPKPSPIG